MNLGSPLSPKWEDLVSSALLGTERKPIAAPDQSPPGAEAATALTTIVRNAPSAAAALLQAAALLGAAKSATMNLGSVDTVNPAPHPVPASNTTSNEPESTEASTTAVQLLDLLLGGTVAVAGQQDELIGEWVDGCKRHGKVVMTRQVLPLLEKATRSSQLRNSTAQVIGLRGQFVARQNPSWKWVHTKLTEVEADTDEGPITVEALVGADPLAKTTLASSWRSRDAEQARLAIAGALPQENAADRTEFVRALIIGLSPADESLLESCLSDKAKGVREAARYVLSQLPTSAFVNRMIGRLAPLVTIKRFPRFSLSVELPDVPTRESNPILFGEWERDGLTGIGARAALLQRLVEYAPLGWWSSITERPLSDILERFEGTDFEREIVIGICHAAVIARRANIIDDKWIVPLWTHLIARDHKVDKNGNQQNIWWAARSSLVTLMTPAELASLFGFCADQPNNLSLLAEAFNALDNQPLGERVALTASVANSIAESMMTNPDQANLVAHHNMGFVLASMSPATVERLTATLLEKWPSEAHRIRHLQAAHSISAAIAKEFP
jgi:hypothetical protein